MDLSLLNVPKANAFHSLEAPVPVHAVIFLAFHPVQADCDAWAADQQQRRVVHSDLDCCHRQWVVVANIVDGVAAMDGDAATNEDAVDAAHRVAPMVRPRKRWILLLPW